MPAINMRLLLLAPAALRARSTLGSVREPVMAASREAAIGAFLFSPTCDYPRHAERALIISP